MKAAPERGKSRLVACQVVETSAEIAPGAFPQHRECGACADPARAAGQDIGGGADSPRYAIMALPGQCDMPLSLRLLYCQQNRVRAQWGD